MPRLHSRALFLALLLAPTEALAHASDRGHVLLLPTGHYLIGGALAVLATFAVLLLVAPERVDRWARARSSLGSLPASWQTATSALALFILLGLLHAGFSGTRDPLANPLPLTVWTVLWVGVTLFQGTAGDLWRWIEPTRAPCALATRLGWRPPLQLPPSIGMAPALPLFFLFAWFELIDAAPDDPERLAAVVLIYFLFTLGACLLFGREAWLGRAEFLSILFSMLARLAPSEAREQDGCIRFALRLPGAGLRDAEPLPLTGTLFLLMALAFVSFDGFNKTFLWLGTVGVNPLEFPGRSAMVLPNGLGLVAFAAGMPALFLVCVLIGAKLSGAAQPFGVLAGRLVWSLVPIALAYHFAHYLTVFLVNAQYWLVSLSDPFWRGWDLLGTARMPVRAAIAAGSDAAWAVWNAQAAAIVLGHVAGVLFAHGLAFTLAPEPSRAARLLAPLTLLMVLYTLFGLWLLSTPTGA
ncbi:MAG: hypothetical protein DI629_11330 [Mesorhizobium amorphae]|nr:MAG: hypothetical protein DI629_11330 [Mesorhizobium amorphae]